MSGRFSWATGCQTVVPSPVSRGGLATRSVARSWSPILSVRTRSSVRSAATRPSLRAFCLKDGTPVEGCPATVRRCCPVTLAGVMEWCTGATIITAWEAMPVDALSRCVTGPAWEALSLCQGALVAPGLQKNINRAIIYVSGSSHTYIQQNEQYIIAHIT